MSMWLLQYYTLHKNSNLEVWISHTYFMILGPETLSLCDVCLKVNETIRCLKESLSGEKSLTDTWQSIRFYLNTNCYFKVFIHSDQSENKIEAVIYQTQTWITQNYRDQIHMWQNLVTLQQTTTLNWQRSPGVWSVSLFWAGVIEQVIPMSKMF